MREHIRPFCEADRTEVISLWQACGLTRPWNNPDLDIDRKLAVDDGLFLVADCDNRVTGSVMAGYDGHRGWINYLAVHPDLQGQGLGKRLMQVAESRLHAIGCPKINLQIRQENTRVAAFYQSMGFSVDECISLGKRLIED